MSKAFASMFGVLLLTASSYGQITGPAEVACKPGRLATITVTADADETTYKLIGDSFDGFREFDDSLVGAKRLRIRVLGYSNGVGYLIVSGQKGGKLLPLFVCKIVVGEPDPVPPTPPVPPKPPDPPPPTDPLAASIRAAAKVDGATPATLQTIADGFRSAVILSARATTASELQAVVIASMKTAVGTIPPATKAVLNGELKALDAVIPPTMPDAALTDANRATAKALFLRLATACEGAK